MSDYYRLLRICDKTKSHVLAHASYICSFPWSRYLTLVLLNYTWWFYLCYCVFCQVQGLKSNNFCHTNIIWNRRAFPQAFSVCKHKEWAERKTFPGSGVVLDCIDSWSLQSYLLQSLVPLDMPALEFKELFWVYSKTCVKRPLKNRKKDLKDKW